MLSEWIKYVFLLSLFLIMNWWGVFRTLPKIYGGAFCKKQHLRCLTGFWIHLSIAEDYNDHSNCMCIVSIVIIGANANVHT